MQCFAEDVTWQEWSSVGAPLGDQSTGRVGTLVEVSLRYRERKTEQLTGTARRMTAEHIGA